MPIFKLVTNVPQDKIPANFAKDLSAALAKAMNKPEQFMVVHLKAGQDHLIFGGTKDPCGYASLTSIGALGSALNKQYSALLSKLVQEKLGISPESLDRENHSKMPMFILWTNISKIPPGFLTKTTKFLAGLTGKSEENMMCMAHSGQTMTYGGSEAPTAFVSFASIGIINPENNKKFSAAICDHVSSELEITKERILIKFQNLQASDVGWNGITRD